VAGGVTDGVLLLRDRQLDPAPAFAHLEAGDYELTFLEIEQASAGAVARGAPVSLSYAWHPGTRATLSADALRPGLYELRVEDARAWVLVCGPATWERVRLEFAQAVSLADTWGPSVSRQDVRSFLRGALGMLASSQSRT
jgi:hypothetical protein